MVTFFYYSRGLHGLTHGPHQACYKILSGLQQHIHQCQWHILNLLRLRMQVSRDQLWCLLLLAQSPVQVSLYALLSSVVLANNSVLTPAFAGQNFLCPDLLWLSPEPGGLTQILPSTLQIRKDYSSLTFKLLFFLFLYTLRIYVFPTILTCPHFPWAYTKYI